MKLPSLDLPDDPQQWPTWLEGQLLGPDLGTLVAELELILDSNLEGPSLVDLLGERLSAVCTRGLTALNADQIRSLLRHPKRLLDLQEWILIEGGDYWSRYLDTAGTRALTAQHWAQLQPRLASSSAIEITAARHDVPSRRRWIGLVIGTLAGGVMLGLGIRLQRPNGDAWGWNRPGVLTANVTGGEYLLRLATAAEEWFARPRDTSASLEQQLADFRRSCDALQAAPLTQLLPAERAWLRDRCRTWATKFDGQLAELGQDRKTFRDVRNKADETVQKLINTLRKQAAET